MWALNATQAQIDDMAAMLDDMKQASVRGDVQHFAQLDFAFHTQMIEAANNPFFIEAMRPFFDLFSESQRLPFSNQEGLVNTMREHAAAAGAFAVAELAQSAFGYGRACCCHCRQSRGAYFFLVRERSSLGRRAEVMENIWERRTPKAGSKKKRPCTCKAAP